MLERRGDEGVPARTRSVARYAFPKGSLAIWVRDALGPLFDDADFADLFADRGRPAASPGRLALVSVLQFADDLTDRQAAEAVRSRIDWKYCLGLELEDPGFHHGVLSDFRDRILEGSAERRVFDLVLDRLAEAGLVGTEADVRFDATRVLSKARLLNRMEFLGETFRAALEALAAADPAWLSELVDVAVLARFETPVDSWSFPKGEGSRESWLSTVGADGFALLDAIDTTDEAGAWRSRIPAVARLRQAWSQQYDRVGGKVVVREGKALPVGRDRMSSPHDPEARVGVKGDKVWLGWKLHATETLPTVRYPSLVVQVVTTPASTGDVEVVDAMLRAPTTVRTAYADGGYASTGAIGAAEADGIKLVAPVDTGHKTGSRVALFGQQAFSLDWEARTATCPAGQQSAAWDRNRVRGTPTIQIKWAAAACRSCELKPSCTTAAGKQWGRTLRVREQAEHERLQRMRALQQTEEWKDDYQHRAGVEGLMSQMVTRTGIRRSRYRGQQRTHLSHLLAGTAVNLARAWAWSCGYRSETTRTSHVERLRHEMTATPRSDL